MSWITLKVKQVLKSNLFLNISSNETNILVSPTGSLHVWSQFASSMMPAYPLCAKPFVSEENGITKDRSMS